MVEESRSYNTEFIILGSFQVCISSWYYKSESVEARSKSFYLMSLCKKDSLFLMIFSSEEEAQISALLMHCSLDIFGKAWVFYLISNIYWSLNI